MSTVNELKPLIELAGAALSPIMAISMFYVAVQQWRINREKSDREIHAIQIDIYLKTKLLLNYTEVHEDCDPVMYKEFQRALAEADFVFDKGFTEWLGEIDMELLCIIETARVRDDIMSYMDENLGNITDEELKRLETNLSRESGSIEKNLGLIYQANRGLLEKFKKNMRLT